MEIEQDRVKSVCFITEARQKTKKNLRVDPGESPFFFAHDPPSHQNCQYVTHKSFKVLRFPLRENIYYWKQWGDVIDNEGACVAEGGGNQCGVCRPRRRRRWPSPALDWTWWTGWEPCPSVSRRLPPSSMARWELPWSLEGFASDGLYSPTYLTSLSPRWMAGPSFLWQVSYSSKLAMCIFFYDNNLYFIEVCSLLNLCYTIIFNFEWSIELSKKERLFSVWRL